MRMSAIVSGVVALLLVSAVALGQDRGGRGGPGGMRGGFGGMRGGAMFGLREANSGGLLLSAQMYTPLNLFVLALCSVLVAQPLQAFDLAKRPQTWGRAAVLVVLFVASIAMMFAQAFNPFLYFQF